jgi:RNA polymerase sigma-70 factor (ECF subfamily)
MGEFVKDTSDGYDASLVKSFQAGDKVAFNYLVLKYQDKIFSVCFRYLGVYQEASDVAQDIFFKVFKTLKKFRFESTFYTWIYRISINTCETKRQSTEQRYKKRMVTIDNPGRIIEGSNPPKHIVDSALSPSEQIERQELQAQVQNAINSLTQEHKTAIILRDIELLSYEQIADTMGISLGTVKSRIARARTELKNKLQEF